MELILCTTASLFEPLVYANDGYWWKSFCQKTNAAVAAIFYGRNKELLGKNGLKLQITPQPLFAPAPQGVISERDITFEPASTVVMKGNHTWSRADDLSEETMFARVMVALVQWHLEKAGVGELCTTPNAYIKKDGATRGGWHEGKFPDLTANAVASFAQCAYENPDERNSFWQQCCEHLRKP